MIDPADKGRMMDHHAARFGQVVQVAEGLGDVEDMLQRAGIVNDVEALAQIDRLVEVQLFGDLGAVEINGGDRGRRQEGVPENLGDVPGRPHIAARHRVIQRLQQLHALLRREAGNVGPQQVQADVAIPVGLADLQQVATAWKQVLFLQGANKLVFNDTDRHAANS